MPPSAGVALTMR
jgi:hypothetical protein